jgi:hypothetical protein
MGQTMVAELLGCLSKEPILVYPKGREQVYAREIARQFDAPLYLIDRALDSREAAGVLVSRSVGTTREQEFNPR